MSFSFCPWSSVKLFPSKSLEDIPKITMKVVGTCFTDNMFPTNGDSCNTTVWKGRSVTWLLDIIQLMNISLPDVEVVTKLSPSKVTHPLIQTVSDGRVDALFVRVGMTYQRSKLVGFSGPIDFIESVVISKKRTNELSGDFLYQTFDLPSFGMVTASILLISFATWISQKHEHSIVPLIPCTFYTFGNALGLGLPDMMTVGISTRQKAVLIIHGLMFLVLSKSFSGTIMASILAQRPPAQIDNLWDVAKMPSLKIICSSGTFWYEDLMSHPATALMEDRIEIRPLLKRDPLVVKQTLNDLYHGTHVLIGHGDTLSEILEISGEYLEDQFHHSDPIMSWPTAFPLSKEKSTSTQKISMGIHWLKAFGLFNKRLASAVPATLSDVLVHHHPNECVRRGDSCVRATDDKKSANTARRRRLQALLQINRNKAFTLNHLRVMFFFLLVGLLLSTTSFIIEVVGFKLAKRTTSPRA